MVNMRDWPAHYLFYRRMMSDNDLTDAVLSVIFQWICKHEHYKDTVNRPEHISIVLG